VLVKVTGALIPTVEALAVNDAAGPVTVITVAAELTSVPLPFSAFL